MKRSKILSALLTAALLASCTSYRSYQEGQDREKVKDWDTAVTNYAKAMEVDPDNLRYKIAFERAKLEASRVHFEKGKALRAAGQNDAAVIELQLTAQLDPTNQYAGIELAKAQASVQAAQQAQNDKFAQMKARADVSKAQPPELTPGSTEPISLSFPHDTSIKDIYRALANAFGINILFDPGVKDEKISIELRDVTAQQALERVMQAGGHFYKVLDPKTIIVVPDTAQNRRDYEDLVIRTFYLSNGDAEQVTNVLRTMLEARNVFPLKALNAITIRDTADKVKIAEKIIEANDKAKAEVVVDVELLQLDLRKILNLGPNLPGSTSQSLNVLDAAGKPLGALTLDQIRNLNSGSWSFTIPSIVYQFSKQNTNTKLLAKPELRISEGEKATLHIGDKVPIKTASFNTAGTVNGGVLGTSYNYQDVGIKITIEPRVHHNREVTLKLNVEVSNVSVASTGDLPPTISTRMIESTIRLKDGETNFLAGLIRRDDSVAKTGPAFLSDIPFLGRFFSNVDTDRKDTDLVLTMTPHIIRIPDITEDDLAPMWVGTTNNITFRGVSPRVESNSNLDAFRPIEQVPDEEQQFDQNEEQDVEPPPPPPQNPPDPFNFTPKPSPNGSIDQKSIDQKAPAVKGASAQVAANETSKSRSVQYNTRMQPRIAPQPSAISVSPGMEQPWSIFGMDLDSLNTSRIVFHYDPQALDVSHADIGTALHVVPEAPPVVKVDSQAGTITLQSSNGDPLVFLSGGKILDIYIRGGITGKTMLVIEPIRMKDAEGNMIDCAVSGGRATVE